MERNQVRKLVALLILSVSVSFISFRFYEYARKIRLPPILLSTIIATALLGIVFTFFIAARILRTKEAYDHKSRTSCFLYFSLTYILEALGIVFGVVLLFLALWTASLVSGEMLRLLLGKSGLVAIPVILAKNHFLDKTPIHYVALPILLLVWVTISWTKIVI